MSDDTSWMDDVTVEQEGATLIKNMNKYVDELLRLRWEMEEAEEKARRAKAAYDTYSRATLPDIFKLNGVTSIQSNDGVIIKIVTKTTASMKKDKESRDSVCKWLREHDGERLIKEELIVDSLNKDRLRDAGVAFDEDVSVNTNSLKAFLLDALGQNGAPATITVEDIPKGVSFYQWDEAEVTK